MDLKEKVKAILPEIKKMVFGEEPKRIFKDAKLKDGSIVRYDGEMPMQGSPVFVITEQGEIPAPTGEHVLEDGTTIVVVDGVITEVKAVEAAPEAPEAEQEMAVETEEDRVKKVIETKVKESYFALETKLNDLQSKYDALEAAAKVSKDVAEKTVGLLEEFAAQPDAEPTEKVSKEPSFDLKGFAKRVKDIKKENKHLN